MTDDWTDIDMMLRAKKIDGMDSEAFAIVIEDGDQRVTISREQFIEIGQHVGVHPGDDAIEDAVDLIYRDAYDREQYGAEEHAEGMREMAADLEDALLEK